MKKLLLATAFISAFAFNANAQISKHEQQKLQAAAIENYADSVPEAGNPHVRPYQSTDGEVDYNDRTISGYQDPYATNSRAYKSNEFGDAAPAPKENIFSEYREPTYRDDNYVGITTDTETYVDPIR